MKRRNRRHQAEHDRALALAYLGARSAADVRLRRIVDEHIARVLEATDDNLASAAELLGVHRRSLERYRRKKPTRVRAR